MRQKANKKRKIRYAVVGIGHIAQAAVLPAFIHASENSELVALVSDDPVKRDKLGRKYKVKHAIPYAAYDELLTSGEIDAAYIALPNSMHSDFTVRTAVAGVHILCEKPMAVTAEECLAMIRAAEENRVKLMIAYRLHFERMNMTTAQIARAGKLGDLRIFNSVFGMQVKKGDIRLQRELGGGTLYDLGVYCINAARYFFRAEPEEVVAFGANSGEARFAEVDEMTSVILKFPGERLATFTTSFGAADISSCQLVGTKGSITLENAYEYAEGHERVQRIGRSEKKEMFPKKDQFAPELVYFSDCILKNRNPEPSGQEGLNDVRIVEAIYRSSASGGKPVRLRLDSAAKHPSADQVIEKPPVEKPEEVHASSPHLET